VGALTVMGIAELNSPGDDPIKVEVFAQQWWWGYRYDVDNDGSYDSSGDIETATEMVIPAGRDVDLTIISNDVIHSFWIPALNGKRDAVPGNPNTWKLNASEPGVYRGQCTEFCGLSHANMRMIVRAVPADEYDDWVAGQKRSAVSPAADSIADEGKTQWESLCAGCHLIDGVNNEQLATSPPALVSGIAPDLTHLMSRGTFAGSIVNLHYPDDPDTGAGCTQDTLDECGDPSDPSLAGNPNNPIYTADLEEWLRNPEDVKPMAPDEGRGMPDLGLTEDQITQLVAYLSTLE
jgi:cytochrome c oxidase subunit 2